MSDDELKGRADEMLEHHLLRLRQFSDRLWEQLGWYDSVIPSPTPAEMLASPKFALVWESGEVRQLTPTGPPPPVGRSEKPRLRLVRADDE